ncbi:Protein kintoun [Hondaea fermentalgiana]|uniref:Protein kintoun n=1 Tax=Hondaea fermentalgiana TaxID=2315210 RepID=A0A2R5GS73_9STRA|nr:Protein kintoun [Hondaea fermentalgiana]|eukprot:GBG32608.1 Protein kintoun [Hondaea fermentalgiana]
MASTSAKKVAEMPDDMFNACVKAAMESGKEKLKMTSEEQEQFMSAMKKPEFTKLMKEYMDEISDPKYREEQETYLRQLERDNQVPENMRLAYPKAGFVVKAKRLEQGKEAGKIFINICSLEELEPPSAQRGPKGVSWSLPYSLGPMRHEKDNRADAHPTFDFALHPDVLRRCVKDDRFRKMVIDTALDAVDKRIADVMKEDVKIKRITAKVLQNVACIGGKPAVMQIGVEKGKENKNEANAGANTTKLAQAVAAGAGVEGNKGGVASKPSAATAPQSKATKGIEVLSETEAPVKETAPEPPSTQPKYTLTHRGKLDLGDFVEDERLQARASLMKRRPKELVVRVQVPKLKSAKYLDIETSEHLFKLSTVAGAPAEYLLNLDLPYPVDEDNGAAKFDKTARLLEVVLPVRPPSDEEIEHHERALQERAAARPAQRTIESVPSSLVQDVSVASSSEAEDAGDVLANSEATDQKESSSASEEPQCQIQDPKKEDEKPSMNEDLKVEEEEEEEEDKANKGQERRVRWADEEKGGKDDEEKTLSEADKLAEILAAAKAAAALPLPRLEDHEETKKSTPAEDAAPPPAVPESESIQDPDKDMEDQLEQSNGVADANFIPSSAFGGAKSGFVFKRDTQGLGYYRDTAPAVSPATSTRPAEAKQDDPVPSAPRDEGPVVTEKTHKPSSRLELRNKSIFDLD